MEETFIQVLIALIPAALVGAIAYFFFKRFMENEAGRRRFLLHKDAQKEALPVRLQAYERLALFLERINPSQLLLRVKPQSQDKQGYENVLINHIEQEFEHNLSQQIYMSNECWNVIKSAKNGTIKLIRSVGMKEASGSADKLREAVLREMIDHPSSSNVALEYLKKEVKELFG